MISKRAVCLFFVVLALLLAMSAALVAQTPGSLTGHVLDPSGAAVPGATVTLTGPNGVVKVAQTDNNGAYTVVGLPPGDYTVRVIAAGFDLFEGSIKGLPGGRSSTFDAKMAVAAEKQEVTVKDTQQVELDPAKNSSALVLKEADLDMLSDDPDDLQADLLALAGPAAGPNGGQIFIDGFSSGQLPPKDSIREIRINSNPYSAEYDTQGHGRIEIFTKPGSDKFHGSVNLTYSDHIWNARNPFDTQTTGIPASDTKNLMATISGPINKKASFFLDFTRRQLREAALINAFVLDPSFNYFQQSQGIIAPTTNTRISPRINYQLTSKITLDARYVYSTNQTLNSGVSGTNLVSTGNTQKGTNQQFFLTETMVVNTATINESRFQYYKNNTNSVSNDPGLNISVGSAFTSGGNYFPNYYNNQGNYELQNYTSITHGTQFIKFGARIRETRISNLTTSGFAGQFNFSNISDYSEFESGLYSGTPLSTLINEGLGPIQFQLNAGPPLFSANQFDAGLFFQDDWKLVPSMTLSLGLRYEIQNNISDHGDWAPRIGYAWGLGGGTGRFRQPKTVIRAGSGYFYDRFSVGNVLNADRYSGVDPGVKSDQSFTIPNPTFFPASAFPAGAPTTSAIPIPAATQLQALSSSSATTYVIDPHLHVPTQLQSAVGVDRQLPHNISLSVNYLYTRGTHVLEAANINTPYNNVANGIYTYAPVSYGQTPIGLYPFGSAAGIINEYSGEGVYRQKQFIINSNARINARFSLFGYYVYGHADTDATGSSSAAGTPSNPYYLKGDYGRAPYDYRNQANINGSIIAPLGIRLSPNIGMRSSGPYNITSGLDELGTSNVSNQRPAFLPAGANIPACSGRPVAGGPPCVANGFVVNPTPGMTIIPMNYGNAYPNFNVNLRISRTWGFGEKITSTRPPRGGDNGQPGGGRGPGFGQGAGPRGGGGGGGGRGGGGGPGGGPGGFGMGDSSGKKYSLTASMMFHNMFNYVNKGSPIGSVISPEFGEVTSLGGGGFGPGGGNAQAFNRRIDFSLRFSF